MHDHSLLAGTSDLLPPTTRRSTQPASLSLQSLRSFQLQDPHCRSIVVTAPAYYFQSFQVTGFREQYSFMTALQFNAVISRDFYWSMSSDSCYFLLQQLPPQRFFWV